jgi:uncharacterized sulfatase
MPIAILFAAAFLGGEPVRYNLVAVVADDQSYWSVGCYGNRESRTPHMDALARQGARFTRAFVATPVCSPSRASYMTGRYGTELGVTDFISAREFDQGLGLPPGALTWPSVLQSHGYRTGLIGKWHLGGRAHQLPSACGFDEFAGEPRGSFAPRDPSFVVDGERRTLAGYSSDVVGNLSVDFLRRNADRPFALCVHFREPHTPYTPVPPQDAQLFANLDPTVPEPPGLDVEQVKKWTREYYAAVHAIDRNLGRILAVLEELGLTERTIVVYTSDHGYNIGHHSVHTKGNAHWVAGGVPGPKRPNMFDTSLQVPLLVRWPGVVRPGLVVDQVVSNIDMFPTVLGMLGLAAPEGALQRGMDFSPMLRGERLKWRDALFGQYDLHNKGLAHMRMIRTDRYKLVRHFRCNDLDELYDLESDPAETKNLYADPRTAAVRDALNARLMEWMRSIDDPLL